MDLGLRGKAALVTGGSKGIGRAVARALASEGAQVLICARDPAALDAAAKSIYGDTGNPVAVLAADLSTQEGIARASAHALETLGGLDILVNNAGAIPGVDFLSVPDET